MSRETQGVMPPYAPYAEPRQPRFLGSIIGPLQLVTPPSGLVVSRALAKLHCRVDDDITKDDTYIDGLITASQKYCEQLIQGHRQFLTATFLAPVACWWHHSLDLPRPPLQSVGKIEYYDPSDTLQTLATSFYNVRTAWKQPGSIERAPNRVWPSLQRDRPYPVQVTFTAGYGAGSAVPETTQQAILMVVNHWYERRAPVTGENVSQEIAFTVTALLESEGYGSYA